MADYGKIGGAGLQMLIEAPAEVGGSGTAARVGGLALQVLVEDPIEVTGYGNVGGVALQSLVEVPGNDSIARVGGVALQYLVEQPYEIGGDPTPDPEPPDDAHPCKPSYTWVSDFIDRSIALFMSQYRNQPRIRALATAIGTMAQAQENEFRAMIDALQLDTATGPRLDLLGEIVGESRGGLGDDDYRRFISARILINFSKGNADTIYRVWLLLTEPDSGSYEEFSPATIDLHAITPAMISDEVANRISRSIYLIKPAGVRLNAIESTALSFRFGAFEDDPAYDDNGFDEGGLARLY